MFSYIEVEKIDPGFQWVELLCEDQLNEEPTRLRLVISDLEQMVADFRRRYQSKHQVQVNFNSQVLGQLNTFFLDFVQVKGYLTQGKDAEELKKVAQTNVINFQDPSKTTLKKSLPARSHLFLEEACRLADLKKFHLAFCRLEWMHLINPMDEMAFEMKMVILRSQGKYGECVSVLEKWIECYPQRVEAYLGLGELWLFLDQNLNALEIFEKLLSFSTKNCMAQIGLAQAQLKLGKEFISALMKASVWDPKYTKEMIEHSFDFRTPRPRDLLPMTLEALSAHFQIPVKRLIGRALRGVLPFHRSPEYELLLFSEKEMQNYYKVLKKLGLEMNTSDLSKEPLPREADAVQLSLFEEYEDPLSSTQI